MKIGIDCRLWNETGVGRYIRNLIKELQVLDKKNEYVLFVLDKDRQEILNSIRHAQDPELTEGQIQNDNLRILKADIMWHSVEEQLKFPQILSKENFDLVHFPYFSVPIFYNNPFVVTIHDLIINHFPTGQASTLRFPIYDLKLLGYKFVIAQAARKAKKIITVSQATKKEIIDHLGVDSDKVIVTYEGVDEKVRSSKSKIKSLIKGKYFLYVGNAYPHKNLERLLEAFILFCHPEALAEGSREILLRFPQGQNDIKFVLVGKEDYFYKRLKKRAEKMGLAGRVKFLQNVTDDELAGLYKNALALVLPSLMEGFGLTALEAMANNCLVLASRIPALQEICADAAVYFDPLDPKNMVEKMKEVCFNDLNHFSEKIKKGLERSKLFSWEKMAKETIHAYEQAAL